MMQIYAIKDKATEAFHNPFFVRARGIAMRMFMDETKNEQSQINKHPDDFELHYIGDFNDETGQIQQTNGTELIAKASDLINL